MVTSTMSNEIKECLVFSSMLPNHSMTFCVFLHWFTFKIVRSFVFNLSKIDLLIFPESLFAGLMSRHFGHKLEYMPHVTQQPRRNRQRNIIWFNPPFSKNVKTNIARSFFLKLVDTHFPIGNKLHKIFNRNTVKVSYSCMNNVKSIITSHNTRIIRKSQPQDISAENCNCRNKHTCPLQNKCMSKDIVYKATILTGNTQDTKHYIGMTSNTFKERYRNHIKSFTHKKYSNETELSKHF